MSRRGIPLARLLAMAFRSLIDELHARLETRGFGGVRPAFGFVLLYARDRQATAQDVAEMLGMTKQAAAKVLEAMESANLIVRRPDPEDARARRILLTAHGRALLAIVEEIYRDLEREWAAIVGRDRVEAMRESLFTVLLAVHGGALPAVRPTW